jgi:hypothetical protein
MERCERLKDFRGLERWCSRLHYFSRCFTICSVKTEVFIEQSSQIESSTNNAEKLAGLYAAASEPSVRFARILGLLDELEQASEQSTP